MQVATPKKIKPILCPLKAFEPFTQMVRHIAVARKITIPEVLAKYATPGIKREYEKIVREEHAQLSGD